MAYCALLLFCPPDPPQRHKARSQGIGEIKLGMNKTEVLDLMQKGPIHFSFDDLGGEISEIVRGDDLFRFATYRFDHRESSWK